MMPILLMIVAVSVLHGQDRPAVVEPVPGTLRKLVRSGERTQVFVLGTAHLNTLGDRFNPGALDGLIAILESYRPQAIGVESLSGPQIAAFTQDDAFAPALKEFAKVKVEAGAKAQQALDQTALRSYRNAIALTGGPHCGDYHRPCYRRLADSALPEVDSCLSAGSNGMVFHGPNANLKQRDSHPTIFG